MFSRNRTSKPEPTPEELREKVGQEPKHTFIPHVAAIALF